MKVKTINFKDIASNNYILSPRVLAEKNRTNQGDGSKDLSPCAKCKKLVEDKYLYSEAESEKEFCFNCFHVVNENRISKEELLSELARIRGISEQGIYYQGKIKKYTPSEKVKLLEACLIDIGIGIWELEKALKVSDIQKQIKFKERFLDKVNKGDYKKVGYDYYKGERHFERDRSSLVETTKADLKELKKTEKSILEYGSKNRN